MILSSFENDFSKIQAALTESKLRINRRIAKRTVIFSALFQFGSVNIGQHWILFTIEKTAFLSKYLFILNLINARTLSIHSSTKMARNTYRQSKGMISNHYKPTFLGFLFFASKYNMTTTSYCSFNAVKTKKWTKLILVYLQCKQIIP